MHYRNAVDLLRDHAGRSAEVPEVIRRVVRFDEAWAEYRATCLLDHATDQFDGARMERVGAAVVRTIQRRMGRAPGA